MRQFTKGLALTVAVLVAAWVVATVLNLATRSEISANERADLFERSDQQSATIETLEVEIAAQEATSQILADQLKGLGQVPVVEPGPTIVNQTTPMPLIQALVLIAVQEACGGTSCIGPVGPASVVPGPTGTSGTNGRDGTPGANGADGAPGAPGRGISNVACEVAGTWTFSFTDGTTQAVAGPCRVVETTPPPETPEVLP